MRPPASPATHAVVTHQAFHRTILGGTVKDRRKDTDTYELKSKDHNVPDEDYSMPPDKPPIDPAKSPPPTHLDKPAPRRSARDRLGTAAETTPQVAGTLGLALATAVFALEPLMAAVVWPTLSTYEFTRRRRYVEEITYRDMAWYGGGYYIGMAAFGCLWLRWQRIFPAKWILCAALFVVLCGNVASGFAPSVGVVILGRIIAGIGAVAIPPATSALAGIYNQGGGDTGTGSSIPTATILVAAWVAASLAAPVLGGALCEYATWRWAFILKTILAAVAAGLVLFVPSVDPPDYYVRLINEEVYAEGRRAHDPDITVPKGELAFATGDWVIAASIFGMEACVVLCFWDWDSNFGLCMAAVMLVPLFFPWVTWGLVAWVNKQSYRVHCRKRVCLATTISFVLSAVPISIAYSASLRLQVSEPSPFKAGVGLLALAGGQELASATTTFITNRVRWHRPLASLGCVCLCGAAVGLFTTARYMFATYPLIALAGIGTGLAERYPILVLQSDLHSDPEALRAAMSILSFWSNAGRVLGITATAFPPINDFLIDKGAPSYTGNTLPLFPGIFVHQKPQLLHTLAKGHLVAIVFAAIEALCVLPAALWLRNLVSDEDWQIHQDQRRRASEAKRDARRLRKAEMQARKKRWPKEVPDEPKTVDKAKEAAMDKEADRDVEKCDTDSVTTIVEREHVPAPPPQYTAATIPPNYGEAVNIN